MKNPKRPRDPNQLAKAIVDLATGEIIETTEINSLAAYASAFGRKGGLVGGKVRAKRLSKAQRIKIAKSGAKARWGKKH